MAPYIPALNEVTRQALDEEPEYPEEDRQYMILFPGDYDGHGTDIEGNVALLLDAEQAKEVRDLADSIITELEGGDADPDNEDYE